MNENPYQAPESDVSEVSRRRGDRSYAGFGARFVAVLLDGLLLFFVSYVVNLALASDYNQFDPDSEPPAIILILNLSLPIAYYLVMWTKRGATLGKMALGIKIVDAEGNNPSIGTSIARYVGCILSAIPFALGYLWMVWDKEKQTWHDKIAGTYVVRSR